MVSSKNLIKSALLLLLIFPVVLLFAACGDVTKDLETKASCTTTGNYAASDEATLNEYVGEQTKIDSTGYRLTAEITSDNGSISVNAIMKENQFAVKGLVSKDYLNYMEQMTKQYNPEYVPTEYTQDEVTFMFYKDGKMYANGKDDGVEKKVYVEMDLEEAIQSGLSQAANFSDPETILDAINSAGEQVAISKDGNNFKLETTSSFVMDGQEIGEASAYLNFDSNKKLKALQMSYKTNIPFLGGNITMTVTMSAFDGNINFPDLSGYVLDESLAGE